MYDVIAVSALVLRRARTPSMATVATAPEGHDHGDDAQRDEREPPMKGLGLQEQPPARNRVEHRGTRPAERTMPRRRNAAAPLPISQTNAAHNADTRPQFVRSSVRNQKMSRCRPATTPRPPQVIGDVPEENTVTHERVEPRRRVRP